jgi:hypothetical protein
MNRMFDLKMMIKATLIVTLSLEIVFAFGCRRKQPDKPAKTPELPVSNKQNLPALDTSPEMQSSVLEANDQNVENVEAADQNVVTVSPVLEKETATLPDTNTKAAAAVQQTETQAAFGAPQEPNTLVEQPSTAQPEETTSSEPLDVNSFGGMTGIRKKMDFISKFAGKSPELLPALVDRALDDEDPGVRGSAMDELLKKGFYNAADILPVVEKAMGDADPVIRQKALDACAHINDPAVSGILEMALQDQSEDVRTAAIQRAAQQAPDIRLPVLEAGITSQYPDVKAGAATELMQTSSPAALNALITALNDPDPDFHHTIKSMINGLIGQGFDTSEQAQKWWNENSSNFGNNLKPIDPNHK